MAVMSTGYRCGVCGFLTEVVVVVVVVVTSPRNHRAQNTFGGVGLFHSLSTVIPTDGQNNQRVILPTPMIFF